VVTSNDIVVLTLTPIIVALTDFAKVDPMPFQMVLQLFASEMSRLDLVIAMSSCCVELILLAGAIRVI